MAASAESLPLDLAARAATGAGSTPSNRIRQYFYTNFAPCGFTESTRNEQMLLAARIWEILGIDVTEASADTSWLFKPYCHPPGHPSVAQPAAVQGVRTPNPANPPEHLPTSIVRALYEAVNISSPGTRRRENHGRFRQRIDSATRTWVLEQFKREYRRVHGRAPYGQGLTAQQIRTVGVRIRAALRRGAATVNMTPTPNVRNGRCWRWPHVIVC